MSRKQADGRAVRARVRARTRRGAPLPEWLAEATAPRALVCAGRAVVEGCRAVAELAPERIALETGRGPVRIEGEGLEIERMQAGSVMVRGRIRALLLGDGDARA